VFHSILSAKPGVFREDAESITQIGRQGQSVPIGYQGTVKLPANPGKKCPETPVVIDRSGKSGYPFVS
jgi:hypothetical protein